jgi:hypothetical protein
VAGGTRRIEAVEAADQEALLSIKLGWKKGDLKERLGRIC